MIRSAAKEIVGWFLRHVYFRVFPLTGSCVVFMFHRVLDENDISQWNHDLAISKDNFAQVLEAFSRQFTCVDLYDWLRHPDRRQPSFAVTFDDGWRDNFTNALPIMRARNVRATVFVTAGMVGTTQQFWFDRVSSIIRSADLAAARQQFGEALGGGELSEDPFALFRQVVVQLKRLPLPRIEAILDGIEQRLHLNPSTDRVVVDWTELQAMSRAGVTIGSHGVNHAILVPLDAEGRRYELQESARLLAARDVGYVPLIAFPNGDYDEATVAMSMASGYQAMVTASSEPATNGSGALLVPRIPVNQKTSVNALFTRIMVARLRSTILSADGLAFGGRS